MVEFVFNLINLTNIMKIKTTPIQYHFLIIIVRKKTKLNKINIL